MIINYLIKEKIKLRDYLESFYLSKSKIYKLFFEKKIYLNDELARESDLLNPGDIISISYDEEVDYRESNSIPEILYEDDYLLIVNKPSHILIHNEKDNTDSLSNMVAKYYKDNNISLNVRFAHRIDYDTTGVVIYCKDILTLSYFSHMIEEHKIRRTYFLLCENKLPNVKGSITLPIGSDRHNNNHYLVTKNGKYAKTNYELIREYDGFSSYKVNLETGRTHQIRVHFSHLKAPLLGDKLYGGKNVLDRCALHSWSVEFIHPVTKEKITVTAPIPSNLMDKIKDVN